MTDPSRVKPPPLPRAVSDAPFREELQHFADALVEAMHAPKPIDGVPIDDAIARKLLMVLDARERS